MAQPERRRAGRVARRAIADEIGFHEFLQWIADRQLARCRDAARRRGMPIGLYLDLAVGVDADGADAWSDQDIVLRGLSVGAPPDEFNTAGPGLGADRRSIRMAWSRSDFAPFRALLRATMRHAGAIRIDHVLGLMRLFMIPRGMSAQRTAPMCAFRSRRCCA